MMLLRPIHDRGPIFALMLYFKVRVWHQLYILPRVCMNCEVSVTNQALANHIDALNNVLLLRFAAIGRK